MSHIGVARDLKAVLNSRGDDLKMCMPSIKDFKIDNKDLTIDVKIESESLCPRYSGVSISNVTVNESPDWLKHKLLSIGINPINNIVDVTNYVLHETGQPLHAFDTKKILGKEIIVKTLSNDTNFITLDESNRKLSDNDLMICNAKEPMCIAGVFGGLDSGVTNNTNSIFIESAYFDPISIRKTAKYHKLNTDASFRYERGCDPNITVYALKRAALLIQELCGGEISSDVVDVYPNPIEDFSINFSKVTPSSEGNENIDFLFSANPDQKLAPLSKVISGGEMSRFLLAIKSSISKKTNTFFLDEIDNGLSGKSLHSLVDLIKLTAQERQVLCITHQPFLAATGNTHFKVKKNVINGMTFTSISKLLTKKERQNELIELIGGGFSEANNYASTLIDRAAA